MDYQELKKWNLEDTDKLLNEAQARLQEFRFKIGANQMKDVREVRDLRKDIARLQTYRRTLVNS